MKIDKTNTTILFCFFSILNLVIFFFRDKFNYHRFATTSSLNSSDVDKWRRFIDDLPKEQLTEAKDILDSLHVDSSTPVSKILTIGGMLHNRFHKQIGSPSVLLDSKTPLDQFKKLSSSDTVRLWCGNFAIIFAFFCWADGVPCRVIEIMNPGDHHVLNECYLSGTNQWVVADVTNNNLLVLNQKNNVYIDLINLRSSAQKELVTIQAKDNSMERNPLNPDFYTRYFGNKNPINYYYRIDTRKVYKTGEKVKRYFFPISWYEEMNSPARGNWLFYVKQLFILFWLISFVLFLKNFSLRSRL